MGDNDMAYTVVARTGAGKAKLTEPETFDSLEGAIEAAQQKTIFTGPQPVEVVVLDENGTEHYKVEPLQSLGGLT
jgi:hypothetical protein